MAGRVLAVDYGGKRTGLAVSDFMGITAQPLPAIISESLEETIRGIVTIVEERQIPIVLVGMPFLPDGREGAQVARVRLFISALLPKLPEGTKIEEIDERHTTKEAEAMWRQAGYSKKKAKAFLDSTAAIVILRDYLHLH